MKSNLSASSLFWVIFCLVGSVYITVGGDSSYEVLKSYYQGCAGSSSQANQQFLPYDIDWCKFRLVSQWFFFALNILVQISIVAVNALNKSGF